MTRSKIVVLTTGGTIASQLDASGRNRSGALKGETLLAQVSLPSDFTAQVEVRSLLQKPSNAITFEDLLGLREACLDIAAQDDVLGIVITHGTDTLEETAYFLDITLPVGKPVVLTGSQRAPHEPGTDAFCNIADALKVAASSQTAGLGPLVVFNQSIFAARQVRKVSTFQVHGFAAPDTGPLGYVDGAQVRLSAIPQRPAGTPLPIESAMPRVDILPAYLGASPSLIEAAVASGAVGLVIEGLGRGHVPPDWMQAIANVTARGIPIMVVSSCASGPVHASYEFIGSLASLESAGVMPVTDLSARKARLALSTLLASTGAQPLAERVKLLAA